MKYTAHDIRAVSDHDGNPRRGYEIRDAYNVPVEFIEVGHQGTQALRDWLQAHGVDFVQKMDYDIHAHITRVRQVTIEQWRRMGGRR